MAVHATVHNFNEGNSGHPKTGRTEANTNTVRILINDGTKSVRKLSAETQVKTTTVHCILKKTPSFETIKNNHIYNFFIFFFIFFLSDCFTQIDYEFKNKNITPEWRLSG